VFSAKYVSRSLRDQQRKPMSEIQAPIVTFYSFKGGVGRSMALANVASLLATKYKRRVLVIDWDLEAPGLHRFFDIPQEKVGLGLINLLNDYKSLLRKEVKNLPSSLIEIKKYINKVPNGTWPSGGSVAILPAGLQDDSYAKQVNEFNWEEFYAKWHGYGFMDYLKQQLKSNTDIDIVLIDSRTGITDIGGICTMQMPDVVVLLFALNEQNIDGIETIVKAILSKSTETTGRKVPPKLILRPARVERYLEQDKKRVWEELAAERLGGYLAPADRENPVRFMKRRSIPYVGAYGFGEVPLAADVDPDAELTDAFEDLGYSILKETGLWSKEDAKIRGVREDEDLDVSELSQPSWFSRFDAYFGFLRSVNGFLFLVLGWLLVVASSLMFPVFRVTLLQNTLAGMREETRLFLLVACFGGIGGCVRLIMNAVMLKVRSPATRFQSLVFILVSAFSAAGAYSAGRDIGVLNASSPYLAALTGFIIGLATLQVFETITTSILPRGKA